MDSLKDRAKLVADKLEGRLDDKALDPKQSDVKERAEVDENRRKVLLAQGFWGNGWGNGGNA